MNNRVFFSSVITVFAIILLVCIIIALKSKKKMGKAVAVLDLSLIPPMIGNLIIIGSDVRTLSEVGCYIYFIGLDIVMLGLIYFTKEYCNSSEYTKRIPGFIFVLLGIDIVQLLLNPVFGHAFDLELIIYQDRGYYRLVPLLGQVYHRVVVYGIFIAVIAIYILMVLKMPRIYRSRYNVILVSMILVGLSQSFFSFSRTPVDRSMILYGIFGVLVFYFAIFYRPFKLLDKMLTDIVSDMSAGLYVFDPNRKLIWANTQGLRLTNTKESEHDLTEAALIKKFGDIHASGTWSDNVELGSGDDTEYYHIERKLVTDKANRINGSVLSVRDNTEEKKKQKEELYNSTHDALTGLYTKEYLFQCIKKALEKNNGVPYYIIYVDVRNFKIINDIFSNAFGDLVLQRIAGWISSGMSERCIFGRLIGDTFGVYMPKEEFNEDRLETELSRFVVREDDVEHNILIHLGIYEVMDNDEDVSIMFDRAHFAMTTITEVYTQHIAYYDNMIREKVLWDQQISAELPTAIKEMQLQPYLQPIADKDGNILGAEALARWIHPTNGFMSPASFIPVFEKNGMIVNVDKHMWRCACEILSRWDNDMFLSINISPKDFYYTDVVADIKGLVKEYNIPPHRLRIEITETVMMTDEENRMAILDDLRQAGFIVEMDDFGSGYSSLNLLKEMPVDVLKIDMRFLSKSDKGGKALTIIRNIIRLSDELGISSLTEGVETEIQYKQLSGMGCKMFQGYYFAKPMPVEDFEVFAGIKKA